MEWISVQDRMPEVAGDYLVYLGEKAPMLCKGVIAVARYGFYHGSWSNVLRPAEEISGIAYWAELPEPPKQTMTLREKVMFGLSHWNDENPETGCPIETAGCHKIGCPYAGLDCELEIIHDAYNLLKEEEK